MPGFRALTKRQVWTCKYVPHQHALPVFTVKRKSFYAPKTPLGVFADDVLGPGFTYTSIPLIQQEIDPMEVFLRNRAADESTPEPAGMPEITVEEPEVTCDDDVPQAYATVIKYSPENDPHVIPLTPRKPRFIALYVHGWNDYFFQREFARHMALAGAAFYGLDLQRYGRSLMPGDKEGYIDDLREYGADFSAALGVIRSEHPDLPLVVIGHSTGGLISSLWVHGHPGLVDGLVLHSPWIEFQLGVATRHALHAVVKPLLAFPTRKVLHERVENPYGKSLKGWKIATGKAVPLSQREFADDWAFEGTRLNETWKAAAGHDIRVGWANAVFSGQERIAQGLNITCPVLCQISRRSTTVRDELEETFVTDVVLNADLLAMRSVNLGPNVTVKRFDARHDVTLSFPTVRQEYYTTLHTWLNNNIPAARVPFTRKELLQLLDDPDFVAAHFGVQSLPQQAFDVDASLWVGGLPPYCVQSICP